MILTQSIYLDSSVLFREAFGEMYMFLPSKSLRNRKGKPTQKRIIHANDTDSSEELPAEVDIQEAPQPEKLPDLLKKSKKVREEQRARRAQQSVP